MYQIGDVQARCWIVGGTSEGRGAFAWTASSVDQRGVGISRTRAYADSTYKGPLCQSRNRRSDLKPAETGPMTVNRGHHRAESARPLLVHARESSAFIREYRRTSARANARPLLHCGPECLRGVTTRQP